MTIELRHLRHVLAVAEHRSFGRAAQALRLTQPALSRSVQAVEATLGAPVFERSRSGVELTELGRLLLRHANAMDAAARDLLRDAALLQGLEQGELRIGAGPFGGAALVGPVVGRLQSLHPQLRIRVVVAPWQELPARVMSRELDLVVAELSAVEQLPAFETLVLTPQRLVMVCRPGHPLLAHPTPTAQQVLSGALVGPGMPQHVQRALAAALHPGERVRATQAPTLAVECDSHAMLKDVLRASDTVSMMPRFMVQPELAAGLLQVLPGVDLGVVVRFGVGWLRERPLSVAGRRFTELLRDHDAALAASETPYSAARPMRRRALRTARAAR